MQEELDKAVEVNARLKRRSGDLEEELKTRDKKLLSMRDELKKLADANNILFHQVESLMEQNKRNDKDTAVGRRTCTHTQHMRMRHDT